MRYLFGVGLHEGRVGRRQLAVGVGEQPGRLRHILHELPRKRVGLVLLLVLVNITIVVIPTSLRVGRKRGLRGCDYGWDCPQHLPFVWPWDWTRAEWVDTVLWK